MLVLLLGIMENVSKFIAKKIASYMLIETEVVKADICIIFGGMKADQLADHAAKLYKQGFFKKIIVSGGVATDDGTMEADRMQARLIGWGIPKENIIVEDKATNTGENVIYSMDLIDKEIGLKNVNSLVAIGQIHASRRFVMTLERHWPEVIKMFTAPNYYPVARKDWHKDKQFKEDVLREMEKVKPYIKKGYTVEIDLKEIARKIAKLKANNIISSGYKKQNDKKTSFRP